MRSQLRYLSVIIPLGLILAWALTMRPLTPPQGPRRVANSAPADVREPGTVESPDHTRSRLALLATAQAQPVGSRGGVDRTTEDYFSELFAQDFAAALQFVSGLEPGELRERLLRRFVRAWAAEDFAGAVEWIAALPDIAERKTAFADACFTHAESNPEEAVRVWQAQQYTADDHVLENLVQGWASRDMSVARAWVLMQQPSLQRDQAVARLGYVIAQSRPLDAANFILQYLPSGSLQTEAAISVLHQWARLDLAGATAWVQKFPEGPIAERARQELAGISTQPFGT